MYVPNENEHECMLPTYDVEIFIRQTSKDFPGNYIKLNSYFDNDQKKALYLAAPTVRKYDYV